MFLKYLSIFNFCLQFSWTEIWQELTEGKGIEKSVVEKIGQYLQLNGMHDLIEKLSNDETLNKDPQIIQGLNDLKLLLNYSDILGLTKNILIDLSLARGLDYYTGVIFEAVLKGMNKQHEVNQTSFYIIFIHF